MLLCVCVCLPRRLTRIIVRSIVKKGLRSREPGEIGVIRETRVFHAFKKNDRQETTTAGRVSMIFPDGVFNP